MRYPFVISLPHCSRKIPEEMKRTTALTNEEIWESTDRGVKKIFGSVPVEKTILAQWNRLVVDLNRSPDRRDIKGVVPQVDYHGRFIYRSGCIPNEQEIERRLTEYYWAFHKQLTESLKKPSVKALFDCHSLNGTGPEEAPDPGKKRKDIVLGNLGDLYGNTNPSRNTISCPPETLRLIKKTFEKCGFSVSLNDPYPGGFITAYHGMHLADMGKIAVQIEINQDLYMEGMPKLLSPGKLEKVKRGVLQAFKEIAGIF